MLSRSRTDAAEAGEGNGGNVQQRSSWPTAPFYHTFEGFPSRQGMRREGCMCVVSVLFRRSPEKARADGEGLPRGGSGHPHGRDSRNVRRGRVCPAHDLPRGVDGSHEQRVSAPHRPRGGVTREAQKRVFREDEVFRKGDCGRRAKASGEPARKFVQGHERIHLKSYSEGGAAASPSFARCLTGETCGRCAVDERTRKNAGDHWSTLQRGNGLRAFSGEYGRPRRARLQRGNGRRSRLPRKPTKKQEIFLCRVRLPSRFCVRPPTSFPGGGKGGKNRKKRAKKLRSRTLQNENSVIKS